MNYKEKKYILQNKWLSQNLTKFDFFIIAHSKSCDSSKWVGFQKDLSKSNLKVKSLSFRNISKVELFSKLPNETIKNLFKGKIVIIYSEALDTSAKSIVDKLQYSAMLRLFLLYNQGRFLNISCRDELRHIGMLEWNSFLCSLGFGVQVHDMLQSHKISQINTMNYQHRMILDLLMNRIENESNF